MAEKLPKPEDQRPDENDRPGRAKQDPELGRKAIEVSRHYLDMLEMMRRFCDTAADIAKNVSDDQAADSTAPRLTDEDIYKMAEDDVDREDPYD